ncbi:MAG: hypothetical protein AAFY56_10290 [Pseudomonadota bacterium]
MATTYSLPFNREQQRGVGVTSDNNKNEDALERRQIESDDLNREIAGTQHSRHLRFLNAYDDEIDPRGRRRDRAGTSDGHITMLQMMLADPAYLALFEATSEKLRDAETTTSEALDHAQAGMSEAQTAFDDLKENANQLSDGTRVYRDADGNVKREDGSLVIGPELDEIVWKENGPKYEEFLAKQQALQDARNRYEELLQIQVLLGGYRDQLEDPDNPLTADELETMQESIDAALDKAALAERTQTASHDSIYEASAGVELPKLMG